VAPALFGASYAGYLLDMLRTLAALGGVCLLAWLCLRALSRRGIGIGTAPGSTLRVVARLQLDAHNSLHVVRAGGRVLLIGAGRGVAPCLIAELEPDTLAQAPPEGQRRAEGQARE